MKTLEARFWSKVEISAGDTCWEWAGSCLKKKLPYGQFSISTRHGRKMWKAHRVSWALVFGNIPEGYLVLHRCDNPKCVRPSHLFLGTAEDNMQDMVRKKRHADISLERNPMWGKPSPNRSGNAMRGKKHSEKTKAQISFSLNRTKLGV